MSRWGALLAATLLLASGCSGEDAPEAEPTSSTPTAPASSTAPSASASESVAPTPSPSSTVPPNTGAVLRLSNSSIQVPEGYELVSNNPDGLVALASNPSLVSSIGLTDAPAINDALTLRERGQTEGTNGYLRTPKFQGMTTVAGQDAYYVAGPIDSVSRIDLFGFVYDGHSITVDVQVPQQMPEEQRQAIVDATLASLTLF